MGSSQKTMVLAREREGGIADADGGQEGTPKEALRSSLAFIATGPH